MSEERLKEIRERHAKATAGPWTTERHDQDEGDIHYEVWTCTPPVYGRIVTFSDNDDTREIKARANATFVAHSWDDVRFLFEAVNRLTEERDALKARLSAGEWQALFERVATDYRHVPQPDTNQRQADAVALRDALNLKDMELRRVRADYDALLADHGRLQRSSPREAGRSHPPSAGGGLGKEGSS